MTKVLSGGWPIAYPSECMNYDVEALALRLRTQPGKVTSIFDLVTELEASEDMVVRDIKRLVKRDGFFDLGNGRVMYSPNADRAAFEVFRTSAPRISFEEYTQYREEPHILMRLSRDRIAAGPVDLEKELHRAAEEKKKARGNNIF